jgi:hypothetical protein
LLQDNVANDQFDQFSENLYQEKVVIETFDEEMQNASDF